SRSAPRRRDSRCSWTRARAPSVRQTRQLEERPDGENGELFCRNMIGNSIAHFSLAAALRYRTAEGRIEADDVLNEIPHPRLRRRPVVRREQRHPRLGAGVGEIAAATT